MSRRRHHRRASSIATDANLPYHGWPRQPSRELTLRV
jgi:hypothetical protein